MTKRTTKGKAKAKAKKTVGKNPGLLFVARHPVADGEEIDTLTLRRLYCVLFQFWRVCGKKSCARAQECRGDPQACCDYFWPYVPEVQKVEFRAGIRAHKNGLSGQDCLHAIAAEVARWRELETSYPPKYSPT